MAIADSLVDGISEIMDEYYEVMFEDDKVIIEHVPINKSNNSIIII